MSSLGRPTSVSCISDSNYYSWADQFSFYADDGQNFQIKIPPTNVKERLDLKIKWTWSYKVSVKIYRFISASVPEPKWNDKLP